MIMLHGGITPTSGRMRVEVNGSVGSIPLHIFKYLLALAAARVMNPDGWIDVKALAAGENQYKYLYALRRQLRGLTPFALIETGSGGRYRLTVPAEDLRFDFASLAKHDDWEIRAMAERIRERIAERRAA